jgi:hypothetical protein
MNKALITSVNDDVVTNPFSVKDTSPQQTSKNILGVSLITSRYCKEGEAFMYSEIEDPETKEIHLLDVIKLVFDSNKNSTTKLSYLEIANSLSNNSFFIIRRKSFFKKQRLENIDYERFDQYITNKLFEYQNKNDDIWVYLVKDFNSLCISFLKDFNIKVF